MTNLEEYTLEDLVLKIEQWAEDRNIINGTKPIDQALKLFSEFGELADNVGKGRDCRDDIGDVFVVLTNLAKQEGLSMLDALSYSGIAVGSLKHGVIGLLSCLEYFVNNPSQEALTETIECLDAVCYEARVKLADCVNIAYVDIKDRVGVVYNGFYIKSTDIAYEGALKALGKL